MDTFSAPEEGPLGANLPKAGRRAGRRAAPQPDAEDAGPAPGPMRQSQGFFDASSAAGEAAAPSQPYVEGRVTGEEAPITTFTRPQTGRDGISRVGGREQAAAAAAAAAPPAAALDPLSPDTAKLRLGGVSRRKQEQMQQEREEAEVKTKAKYEEREVTASVTDIPELEEQGKEDLTRVVAEAPRARANKVQAIAALDDEAAYKLPKSSDVDVDLSLLAAVLCPLEQVEEGDEEWTADQLFTDVASELRREADRAAGIVPEAEAEPAKA